MAALGDGTGRFARADEADGNAVRFSTPESWVGYALMMQEEEVGHYVLKPFGEAPALAVAQDGVVRALHEQVFVADPPHGPRMTLRTGTGQVLAVDGAGRLVARPAGEQPAGLEMVVLQSYDDAVHGQHDCCGAESAPHDGSGEDDDADEGGQPHDRRLHWNDPGHQRIVEWARDILRAHRGSVDGVSQVCRFLDDDGFWNGVRKGLKEADNGSWEYSGAVFSSHFYDPDTGTNYLGGRSHTALTQADRRFREAAVLAISGGATYEAGFALGLALHYLTDLTQPMHASNFPNLKDGPFDVRHSRFEKFLDRELKRAPGDFRLDPASVNPAEAFSDAALHASTEALVRSVARFSKDLFVRELEPLMPTHPGWIPDAHKIHWPLFEPGWVVRTRPLLPRIVQNAQLHTARFLVRWGRAVSAPAGLDSFVAPRMREGDRGVWTFSRHDHGGVWRRGDHDGRHATVTALNPGRLAIEGEFSAPVWGVIPFDLDVWHDVETGGWKMRVRNGKEERRCDLQPPRVQGLALVFEPVRQEGEVGEPALEIRPLQTQWRRRREPRWYGGVQLAVAVDGLVRYACFEDTTHY